MTTAIGEILAPYDERLGDRDPPEVLTLTEKNGFVAQSVRFNKRLATEDVSGYKVIHHNAVAFNPYLLWAGAVAQNIDWLEGVISPLYPTFRVRDGYDPRFIGQLLHAPQIIAMYDSIAFGSVPRRRRSSPKDFLSLTVPDPPSLPEQRRIAEILDRADALRARRSEAIAHLDDLTQAVFLDMFGDPGAIGSDSLADHVDRIDSGQSPVCLDRPATADEWGVLKLGAVSFGTFDATQNKALRPETIPDVRHQVRQGDVLVSRKNTRELVGASVFVSSTRPRLLLPDLVFRLVPRSDALVPRYLHAAISSAPMRRRLSGLASGSAVSMVNISKAKLLAMPIQVPSKPLQETFADRVAHIESLKAIHRAQLTELDALFESLQQRAFAGEL